jgi:hypothetical protein
MSVSQKIVKQAMSFTTPNRLPVFERYWDEFVSLWRDANPLPNSTRTVNSLPQLLNELLN